MVMKRISVGIDIGGTNTALGLVDVDGNVLAQDSVKTCADVNDEVKTIADTISKLLQSIEPVEVVGIGIGAPNGNYYSGCIEGAANLHWKGKVELVKLMRQYIDVPTFLTNDANAAAIGEMVYGAAKGMKDFIVITLGTGLGSGIVVNGRLLYGHDGFAGELGHVNAICNGRICGCGRRGCVETYVSATGVVRTATELLSESMEPSELRSIPNSELTSLAVTQAANRGDSIAKQVFERTGEILGRALADAIAFSSPQAIFLFGGLAGAGDLLFEPTRRSLDENVLSIFKGKAKILPSGLKSNAAILGASALVWGELNQN